MSLLFKLYNVITILNPLPLSLFLSIFLYTIDPFLQKVIPLFQELI